MYRICKKIQKLDNLPGNKICRYYYLDEHIHLVNSTHIFLEITHNILQ